jgi:type II secretory pathway pseudopilin PulG
MVMRPDLNSAKLQITNRKSQIRQRGYMMITLMLALAMITLAMLAVLPDIRQQIRRDREEELRHRGTAYMRAIQHFYKKFGRYPNRVEELEDTNNLRFLRKRYTDPINVDKVTGKEKDFKFLHQQDISLNNGPVLGATPGQSGPSGQGGIGSAQGGPLSQGAFGGAQPGANSGSPAAASGNSSNASEDNEDDSKPSGSSPSNSNPGSSFGSGASSSSGSSSGSGFNGPTFGGGPILGVASASTAKAIHVFYTKDHYNDWLFIYLPTADRGGLLIGPINPGVPTGIMGGLAPGQMPGGTPGQGGFGQGFGSTPNGGQSQGPQTQTPPQAPAPAPAPQQ